MAMWLVLLWVQRSGPAAGGELSEGPGVVADRAARQL